MPVGDGAMAHAVSANPNPTSRKSRRILVENMSKRRRINAINLHGCKCLCILKQIESHIWRFHKARLYHFSHIWLNMPVENISNWPVYVPCYLSASVFHL